MSAETTSDAPLEERPLFFYGTLRDPDLLAVVIGRKCLTDLDIQDAAVDGFRLSRVAGESFPMLFEAPGETAEGVLIVGLSREERARVGFFEDSDYALAPATARLAADGARRAAAFYRPTEKLVAAPDPWRLDAWAATEKPLLLACAEEQLSYFGVVPQHVVELWWPDIKARAERRLGLSAPSILAPFGRDDVEERARAEPYAGFFRVTDVEVAHRRFRGAERQVVARAAWRIGDVTTVLPYDPVADAIVLIEQWRPGPWVAGDARPWIVETVAGRIEPGEAPEAAARREAEEEAGVALDRIERIAVYYSSPGAVDERVFAFVGRADLSAAGGVFGVDHEGEDIRAMKLDFWRAMEAMARGEIAAGPAMLSLLWLARNRDRLRFDWL